MSNLFQMCNNIVRDIWGKMSFEGVKPAFFVEENTIVFLNNSNDAPFNLNDSTSDNRYEVQKAESRKQASPVPAVRIH
jgi:hypothetical protein